MSVRCTAAGILLVLAASGCVAPRTEPPAAGAPGRRVSEVCHHDAECAPRFACTSDHHCRCQFDEDCAATQRCRAGLCLSR